MTFETEPDPLDGNIFATEIMGTNYPALEYVVPGVIPEGLTLLVAAPKIGKSWMSLGIAVAASSGGVAFGCIPVDPRPVLYLALEDGPRRLQSRLKTIHAEPNTKLQFRTGLDGFAPGAVIGAYLERYGDQKPLIILDTLGKVRGISSGNDTYGRDYTQMSSLKDLVDAYPGSALVVVHHTNKGEHGDFMSAVSGTQGLAGAADTIAVIKRERGTGDAILSVSSRDAMEGEYAVTLTDGAWRLDGSNLQEASQAVQNRAVMDGTGDVMQQILAAVQKYPEGVRPQELVTITGFEKNTVDVYLKRAFDAGRVARPKRGTYTPVSSVSSVSFPGSSTPELTQLTKLTPPEDVSSESEESPARHTNNRNNTHRLEVVK